MSAARVTSLPAKDRVTGFERTISIVDIATEAAARLNLTRGRDNKWRGRCPACGYHKPTLEVGVEHDRIRSPATRAVQPLLSPPQWGLPAT